MIQTNSNILNGYTFIDLFAGLGGFHLALESFGAKCIYASEWDKAVAEVYENNFGMKPDGDITKVNENDIPDHDILCAGFPCPAFSISGKQLGFADTRGTLFFDVARIVKAKQPKVVFLENVRNLLAHDNGKTFKVMKNVLEELGYNVHYKVLNGTDFNVPQDRKRIFIVAFRKDINDMLFTFPEPICLTKHVEDCLEPESEETEKLYTPREINPKPDNKYSNKPIRLGVLEPDHQGQRYYSTKGVAITFSANGGGTFSKTGGYVINGRARRLLPREMARMCGFPDTYKLCKSDAQARKQFGNTVIVDVLQHIVREISKMLDEKSEA